MTKIKIKQFFCLYFIKLKNLFPKGCLKFIKGCSEKVLIQLLKN